MRSLLTLAFLGGLALPAESCIDDKGLQRTLGEEWRSLESFVVRCESDGGGGWKTRVLHCLTHNSTPVPIGAVVLEDAHSYRCLLDGDEVRIRVRPASDDEMSAPVRDSAIPNVLCYMPGRQSPLIFGQEIEYNGGVVKCALNGEFEYTHCTMPNTEDKLEVGASRLVGSIRYTCAGTGSGVRLLRSAQAAPPVSSGAASELSESPGCLLTGRADLATVGEELVVDGKYIFECDGDGVARLKACVLVSGIPSDNQKLLLGEKRVFQGLKYQCKKVGVNAAALLAIPATPRETVEAEAALPQKRLSAGGMPRRKPAARKFLSSGSTGEGLFAVFDCPTGNLTLIKEGTLGGFVKRCTEGADGLKSWVTAFCYTPEGEWIPVDATRRLGDRVYYCARKASGRVSLRVDGPALNSVTDLMGTGALGPPRATAPEASNFGSFNQIPGCKVGSITRGNGERWEEGQFVKMCQVSGQVAESEIIGCLTPSHKLIDIGSSETENSMTWDCFRKEDGSIGLRGEKPSSEPEVLKPATGGGIDAAYGFCSSKDGKVKLRVGQRKVVSGVEYQCRYQDGIYAMLEKTNASSMLPQIAS